MGHGIYVDNRGMDLGKFEEAKLQAIQTLGTAVCELAKALQVPAFTVDVKGNHFHGHYQEPIGVCGVSGDVNSDIASESMYPSTVRQPE